MFFLDPSAITGYNILEPVKEFSFVQVSADFSQLMQRVREGSQDAARELIDQYGPHIFRVVRRRLTKKLRAKFDSSDFVQSVWASFYAIPSSGQTFDSPEALISFLVNVARNKVVEVYRQRCVGTKYNVIRERSLEGSAAFEAHRVTGKQPSPSQVAGADEEFKKLVEKVPAHQRGILVLLRQGNTHQEIADQLGVDEKTVRRLIRRIAPEILTNVEPRQASSL